MTPVSADLSGAARKKYFCPRSGCCNRVLLRQWVCRLGATKHFCVLTRGSPNEDGRNCRFVVEFQARNKPQRLNRRHSKTHAQSSQDFASPEIRDRLLICFPSVALTRRNPRPSCVPSSRLERDWVVRRPAAGVRGAFGIILGTSR